MELPMELPMEWIHSFSLWNGFTHSALGMDSADGAYGLDAAVCSLDANAAMLDACSFCI